MSVHYEGHGITVHHGDCLDVLATIGDNTVDAVVTDPPYGLEFMGKDWDAFRPQRDPRTAGRSGEGAMTGGAGITATGYTDGGKRINRAAFGGKRPSTWRCDTCGVRNQFRNKHATTAPDCPGTWIAEVIDPDAPSPLLPFQSWCQTWATECLRVLKPGGHLLAFGGTRTSHRLTCAIEDAGFEIRDSIAWLYGSGFPKSLDVSKAIDKAAGVEREAVGPGHRPDGSAPRMNVKAPKFKGTTYADDDYSLAMSGNDATVTAPATDAARQWQGWGTALKPAHEPITVARKPLAGTVAANVVAHGVGALNIGGCRVGSEATFRPNGPIGYHGGGAGGVGGSPAGRWPANVVLDKDAAAELDRQSGERPGMPVAPNRRGDSPKGYGMGIMPDPDTIGFGDTGGASRFFYTAKAGSAERVRLDGTAHATVKPLSLMRWLVRLVTPPGGTCLDPFAGSGTTAEACLLEGMRCIAIEREAEYLPLITQRINRRRDPEAAVRAARVAGEPEDLFGDAP